MSKRKILLTYLVLTIIVLVVPTFLLASGVVIYIIKFGHLYPNSKRVFTVILCFYIFIIIFEIFKFFRGVI